MTSRMSDHDQMRILIMSWPWRIFLKSFMMIAYGIIEILHTQEIKKKERKKQTKIPDNYKEWSANGGSLKKRRDIKMR